MNSEDLIIWPDNSWCYAEEIEEYHWKSDDYTIVSVDDPKYDYYLNCNFLYDEVMKGYANAQVHSRRTYEAICRRRNDYR